MKIHEISKRLGISRRTIRFYEQKGLIKPSKESNQYRIFSEQDAWRLQTIIALREVGMSIETIKASLAHIENDSTDELQYYLELQRSVIFSQWLELKQIIQTTDLMIANLKKNKKLVIEDIYQLAEGSKRLRDARNNWRDQWNFDLKAEIHDEVVQKKNEDEEHFLYRDYDKAHEQVVKWIHPLESEVGLDIGTGTGNLAGKFLSEGIKMAGIDQSKEMLKVCQRKFPTLETKMGNFLAIPYIDNEFDFVVSAYAFHLINEEQKRLALEEMRRVLKPHGRICIADIMFENRVQRESFIQEQKTNGREDVIHSIENRYYSLLDDLLLWFEQNGYLTRFQQLNEWLYIVYAVPIHR